MPRRSPIRNIVLDTSFVEAQNFLAGNTLSDLQDLSKKGLASIFITDIVYREIISRFKKRVTTAEEKAKSAKKALDSNLMVLKNFPEFNSYFNLPEIDIEKVVSDFVSKFDLWIKETKVKIIPTGHSTIDKVFNDYFENNPPFKEGDKKHEFPDAFSHLAVEEYFSKKRKKCYFVTSDSDFDDIKSDIVFPVKEIREKIDLILRAEKEKEADTIALIERGFEESLEKLKKDARQMITDYLEEEVNSKSQIGEMEIDTLEKADVSDIDITDYSIVFIGNVGARLECSANFAYELTVAVEDRSNAWYDKEDDIWHFVENTSIVVKGAHDVIISVVIDFDLEEDYAEADVEDINYGKWFKIFEEWDNVY